MSTKIACRILTVTAFALCLGACATQKAAETEGESAQEGPQDASAAPLPEGPEVDKEGIRPQEGAEPIEVSDAPPIGESSVTRTQLERFRDRGPAFVLTLLQFEPVHGNTGFRGFKIVEAKDSARDFMTPLVQMGDVVTHINGIRIERPDDFLQAWKTLEDASVIRIDLIREEDAMNVTWAVEE